MEAMSGKGMGLKVEKIIWNGKLVSREDAKVDIEDRGYQFGDGIYEVVRVYNGHLFTLREHMERLFESARKIKLEVPYSISQIEGWLKGLVAENNLQSGTVYVQITRGQAPRNHLFPEKGEAVFVAKTNSADRPADKLQNGVAAITVEDIRWLKCDIKSLNLLGNILAKQTAFEQGCFEAIQHRGGMVTEGSSSNISIVSGGQVITHPANNLILNGIVRQVLLGLCRENRIPFKEEPFSLDQLYAADEVFMTSTTSEIMPITEIDGKQIGDGMPGELTKKLQALYEQAINSECGLPAIH